MRISGMKTKIVIYRDGTATVAGSMLALEREAAGEKVVKFGWLEVDLPPYHKGGDENEWQAALSKVCRDAAREARLL